MLSRLSPGRRMADREYVRHQFSFLLENDFTFIRESDMKLHPLDLLFVQLRLFHDNLDY
jgi:hypothetical protein